MKQNIININDLQKQDLYLIGLICSDGHVCHPKDNSSSKGYRCHIDLKHDDGELLLKIHNRFGGNIRSYIKTKSTIWSMSCKSTYNKKFIDFMTNIGITHNKSLTLNINKWLYTLPHDKQICFLRGFLDGDGWISNSITTKTIGICSGSKHITDFFYMKFPNAIQRKRVFKNKNHIYTACLHWRNVLDAHELFNTNIIGDIFMKRKQLTYETLVSYFDTTPIHKYKSDYVGVYQHKNSNKYFSRIRQNYKIYELGYYNTELECAVASDIAATILKTKRIINIPKNSYDKYCENKTLKDIPILIKYFT